MHYSRQREKILEYVQNRTDHPSAEQIYLYMREEIPNISLGTVYRNLKVLEEMKEIRRVLTPLNEERYDTRMDNHAHFICRNCGKVIDLNTVDNLKTEQLCEDPSLGAIYTVTVTIEGECAECMEIEKSGTVTRMKA